ncbi:carbohydrate kinase family protein [Flavobacterium aquiphilum]|uniref:carbohydrate kinase family protein n=1 Tax=Flavobacterium aquiphilum TaxID=3003261 RepID=UPI002480543B|nr:carbohydrate kinase [Flavobacterium aquiphilum]
MDRKLKGVCFGEILFDVFIERKKIGGAPLNVASRLSSLGGDITVISGVGNDADGKILMDYLKNQNINTEAIQVNNGYSTGLVNVILDEKGNASYDIHYPSAWDKIELSAKNISLVKNADFFVYGSLSTRDSVSENTLKQFLSVANYKVFDANLRSPYYDIGKILDLAFEADLLKLNDDELDEIYFYLNADKKSLEQKIEFIAQKTNAKTVCVTLGAHGAILFFENKFYRNFGFKVNVMDTVGSGDSFLAALIINLLGKNNPQYAIDFSCAVGSIVAQSEGANPTITQLEINELLSINP